MAQHGNQCRKEDTKMTRHEFDIIQTFFDKQAVNYPNIILGIGDDAAIVSIPPNHELVITTDTLVSGIHFSEEASAYDIGHKALAVNLSDLAAMGATPAWVTLALTIPAANESWLHDFSAGFFALADLYTLPLIGGDLTCGPHSITIQAHGLIPAGLALRRDQANEGDLIYVTNNLGDAGLALNWRIHPSLPSTLLEKLHRPMPAIAVGEKLRGIATTAIDISDGLAADLSHILTKSGKGADINVDTIPLSATLRTLLSHEEAIQLALTAGDDYELCFTVPPEKKILLEHHLQNFCFTCIGTITSTHKLNLHFDNGRPYVFETAGYQHF